MSIGAELVQYLCADTQLKTSRFNSVWTSLTLPWVRQWCRDRNQHIDKSDLIDFYTSE